MSFYVANSDAVVRCFPYRACETQITAAGTKVLDLPAGSTKNLTASEDGFKLHVTVGSNSNVGERGLQHEGDRAAIWEIDLMRGTHRVFASGLRNPNGLAWEPSYRITLDGRE